MSADSSTPNRRPLNELAHGERLDGAIYLLTHRELRTGRNGSLYLDATVSDNTGRMRCRMWDAAPELLDSLTVGRLISVRGRAELYSGRVQLVLDGVSRVDDSIDPAAYLPATREDIGAMWERVKAILRTIRQPDLLKLVGRFINDESFSAAFQRSPAAQSFHHAYVGGLLEHTLALLELAEVVLPRYPRVNRDLVLAGLFLHDAGKTVELRCEVGFDYSVEGNLIGHIVQCVSWIDAHAAAAAVELGRPLDASLVAQLKHIVAAHHGAPEWGSPKLPMTPEAVLVHYLDNIDAKMNMIFAAYDDDPDPESSFTAYVKALGVRLLKR